MIDQEARVAAEASLSEKMALHQKNRDEEMEEMLRKIQEHQEKVSKVKKQYSIPGSSKELGPVLHKLKRALECTVCVQNISYFLYIYVSSRTEEQSDGRET